MTTGEAFILGIVQGLSEFLPVSSSGHLVLGQYLFGVKEPVLLFDIILHVGTLFAVVIVFRREIVVLALEVLALPQIIRQKEDLKLAWRERTNLRLLLLILIGTIPTGLIGLIFKDAFESLFGSILTVGLALLATGTVLFTTKLVWSAGRTIRRFDIRDALLIGLAQGLAIIPGLSRSGVTISTGLFLGLERELAARYSFLLSIPAILGALILELGSVEPGSVGLTPIMAGFMAALISGLLALVLLLGLVRRGRLHYFSYYCWLIGLVAVICHFTLDG